MAAELTRMARSNSGISAGSVLHARAGAPELALFQRSALEILRRSLSMIPVRLASAAWQRVAELLLKPRALERELGILLAPQIRQVLVVGPLEERVLLLHVTAGRWIIGHLGARPLVEIAWPEPIGLGLSVAEPGDYVSVCDLSSQALFRLTRPLVSLIALCHPDTFPLPRFPLGISDLARALRLRFQGQVSLADMQLGLDVRAIFDGIAQERPDIVGISATFGQHDLLVNLADRLVASENPPLLVFGGSLCALNAAHLLASYPLSLVAHGPGEITMQDAVEHWHGDRLLGDVRGAHSTKHNAPTSTEGLSNKAARDFLPELDLLEETLDSRGVMQLESSRGCTHACSFCPRQHKGIWAGGGPAGMEVILDAIDGVFSRRPAVSRKIFLVDEEFVGDGTLGRALDLADALWNRDFRWETSARVNQIYRPDRGRDWHVERMSFWKGLRERGLDRCLFGIESGVDSILRRFNKRTTARQNVLALRLLSACGIPIRCTYITFDQLMSVPELEESYLFQGRTDVLLYPQPGLPLDELFDAIQDEAFAAAHARGAPLYESITYLLVSMECLLGSPYLRRVEAAGLALEEVPSMGRRNAAFREPGIGLISDSSQRWVDRNFSFDYMLKSLEKIASGVERAALRHLRALLKEHAYRLLGKLMDSLQTREWPQGAGAVADLRDEILELMNLQFIELVVAIESLLLRTQEALRPANLAVLRSELQLWSRRQGWPLINH